MLNSVLDYQLPIAPATEMMELSRRHTNRLLAACRRDGPPARYCHYKRRLKNLKLIPATVVQAAQAILRRTRMWWNP